MATKLVRMGDAVYEVPEDGCRALLNALVRGEHARLSDHGARFLGSSVDLLGKTRDDAIQALHDLDDSEAQK